MEQHLAFEDNGMQCIHLKTEAFPNFEDCLLNSHQLVQKVNKVLLYFNNYILIRMI